MSAAGPQSGLAGSRARCLLGGEERIVGAVALVRAGEYRNPTETVLRMYSGRGLEPGRPPSSKILATNSENVGAQSRSLRQSVCDKHSLCSACAQEKPNSCGHS